MRGMSVATASHTDTVTPALAEDAQRSALLKRLRLLWPMPRVPTLPRSEHSSKQGLRPSAMLSLERSLAITAPVPLGKSSSVTVPATPNKGTPKLLLRLRPVRILTAWKDKKAYDRNDTSDPAVCRRSGRKIRRLLGAPLSLSFASCPRRSPPTIISLASGT